MAPLRVAAPPAKPLLVYDGRCGFCKMWIRRWERETGGAVDYAPSQEAGARFPEIPPEAFGRSVQLVLPDGEVLEGAHAVLRALAAAPGKGWPLALYPRVPLFAPAAEGLYRLIARRRDAASAATRVLWGRRVEKPSFLVGSDLFLRAVGLCFLAAFVSLWVQIDGLVGSRGILPASAFFDAVRAQAGGARWDLVPSLLWVGTGDGFLHALCAGGTLAALLAVAGVLPAPALAFCWAAYLSLSHAGQVFLQFQWDSLLLEAGLVALLVAPWSLRATRTKAPPSPVALFLARWLLARLMFSSGFVKLASGDPAWRSLTALRYHYQTQPLPPWTAWYAHQAPPWFQTLSAAVLFAIELGLPLFVFGPRRLRLAAALAFVFLQTAIAATGNYAFFNLLAVALCLPLLDDAVFPASWRRRLGGAAEPGRRRWPRAMTAAVAAVLLIVSGALTIAMLFRPRAFPRPVVALARAVEPFRSVNTYGLFAVMTTSRPEIVLEGSDDAASWRPYEFRWKPGDVKRRPAFVAPHQPRLDWQMWFAALGSAEEQPWLLALVRRLLEGSPSVSRLFAAEPFPGRPPRYVRAVLYDYRFTTPAERRATGAWWKREELGLYLPALSRENFR
jgi:predicted DCC family thiol-disulfide oxidoreductase YuxK